MPHLKVTVVKAKNLKAADSNGLSDPYCVLRLGDTKAKTKVKKKTLNPVWKHNFTIDLAIETLHLQVWDKDRGSKDDFLGEIRVQLSGIMLDGSDTWFTLQNRPGKDDKVTGEILLQFSASEKKSGSVIKTPRSKRRNEGSIIEERPPSPLATVSSPSSSSSSSASASNGSSSSLSLPPDAFVTGSKLSSSAQAAIKKKMAAFIQDQSSRPVPFGPFGSEGKIPMLDLSSLSLTHIPHFMAEELAGKLKGLDLGHNKLSNYPQLSPFSNLEVLRLEGNQMNSLPPIIASLVKLRELHLMGNQLRSLPPQLGQLTCLEKLFLNNNQLSSLCPEIGQLERLEELHLSGNPLGNSSLPRTIGRCTGMEVMDLSFCSLEALPNEFTRMTRLLELNLATNRLTALPATIGRMTRLVRLDLSDNLLKDLPMSIGYCVSMEALMLERNPIKDTKMMQKYGIGTDHLMQYLQSRMEVFLADHPDLALDIRGSGGGSNSNSRRKITSSREGSSSSPSPSSSSSSPSGSAIIDTSSISVEEKLRLVKKDATTLISDVQVKLSNLKRSLNATTTLESALPAAQMIRRLKTEMDKVKHLIPAHPKPNPPLIHQGEDKLSQVKKTVNVALYDLELTINDIQNAMLGSTDPQVVVPLVKTVKLVREELNSLRL